MTADMRAHDFTVQDVKDVVIAVGKILHGKDPALQDVALADLLATFLAGHYVPGNQGETIKVREDMLARHVQLVRSLIPVNARMIHRGDDP